MGERRVRNAEVEGSNPFGSTKNREKDCVPFSLIFFEYEGIRIREGLSVGKCAGGAFSAKSGEAGTTAKPGSTSHQARNVWSNPFGSTRPAVGESRTAGFFYAFPVRLAPKISFLL